MFVRSFLLIFIAIYNVFIAIYNIFFAKIKQILLININLQRVDRYFFSLYNYFCYTSFLQFNSCLLFNLLFYVKIYSYLFFETNTFFLLKNKKYNSWICKNSFNLYLIFVAKLDIKQFIQIYRNIYFWKYFCFSSILLFVQDKYKYNLINY